MIALLLNHCWVQGRKNRKIGQYLPKLWAIKYGGGRFMNTYVYPQFITVQEQTWIKPKGTHPEETFIHIVKPTSAATEGTAVYIRPWEISIY